MVQRDGTACNSISSLDDAFLPLLLSRPQQENMHHEQVCLQLNDPDVYLPNKALAPSWVWFPELVQLWESHGPGQFQSAYLANQASTY